jgi:hypothetical protein
MPRTSSIMDEASWREHFGWLLSDFSEKQQIKSIDIGRALDALPGSTGRNRLPDWSHYTKGDRIPTQPQLRQLANVLRIPFNVLRLASGYVDETIECCSAVAESGYVEGWAHAIGPRRAAFGLLFSLFRCEGMHIDNRWTMIGLMLGTTIRLNVFEEQGFMTGSEWNATWLYPETFRSEHLQYDKFDSSVHYVGLAAETSQLVELDVNEETYVSNVTIKAEAQIDVASPIATSILSVDPSTIPRSSKFAEAQRVLHARALPLEMRIDHAGDIIHLWADELDKATAEEVREHLQQWDHRSLTQEAAQWIRGELSEKPERIWW